MSFTATHESKDVRRSCQSCRDRKARFQHRGRVRADRNHTLCFECFRSERDRQRARRFADIPAPPPLALDMDGDASSEGGGTHAASGVPACSGPADTTSGGSRFWDGSVPNPTALTARQIAHRRAMLAHLQLKRASADR